MATKNTTAGAETAAPEKVQAAKFTVERLAANCRQLFGVSSCAYAGAITDVDYDNDFLVDRDASHGDETFFNVGLQPVDSAEKLYFTISTR